jgi:uncharacterized membrane protein
MQGFRPFPPGPARRAQRGALAAVGLIWLMVALVCLMSIDIGNVFWQRREVQKLADLAALAAAEMSASGCANASTVALANAAANGLKTSDSATVTCGNWNPKDARGPADATVSPPRYFRALQAPYNAALVTVSRTVPFFFVFNFFGAGQAPASRTVTAQATAARAAPVARLSVQSTLVTVGSSDATLLNAVFGGLLGGSLNLSAVGWQGLLGTNINLLNYFDRLALNLGVAAGDYTTLLATQTTLGSLLQAAADVLGSGSAAYTALIGVQNGIGAAVGSLPIQLGSLIQLQTGTPSAALNANLQVFQLVQGLVQLANSQSAVAASVSLVNLPGIGSVSVKLKVTEPPQISAIGNPAVAAADSPAYAGPNQISVRTAQIRSLIAINIPGLSVVTGLLNAVTSLLAPVTSLLNNVLSLNLVNILCLVNCTGTQVVLVPDNPVHLDINLDIAPGQARVSGFNCPSPGTKTLTVDTTTSAANLRIGQMTAAQEAAIFSSSAIPVVTPIPLLDVQTKTCTLYLLCGPWTPYSRTGLAANTSVAASTSSYLYTAPPDIDQTPAYYAFSTTNIVNSLSSTLSGLQLQTYKYSTAATNHFGDLVGSATQLVNAAVSAAQAVVGSLLSPLLDPLVNLLLSTLGINLASVGVGAQLTCDGSVELVY